MGRRQHPDWMREFDHTADVGVEVESSTLPELFERAAYAMFWLLADVEVVASVVMIPIEVDAADRSELLVKWLSELNYRHQVDGLVFSQFVVDELDDTRLAGSASGEAITDGHPQIYCELKAVTFHELEVACGDDGCRARVIFDI